MSKYERMARIEGIDLDTGQFTMTLATEGEASDGHILSIKGGQIPERIPMQNSHINSPLETFGSITNPEKLLKDSPPRVRALGHIEMEGEEPARSIRRDLAHMISQGHVTGVSVRWDEVPGKTIRRVNLPSDHPHFVDEKTAKGPERWGSFFEEWIGREGSIVALQADKAAVIGRADETEGEVSSFWRQMAEHTGTDPEALIDGEQPEDESPEAKIAASLAGLRIDAADCREAGATHADMINAVVDGGDADVEAVEVGDHVIFMPGAAAEELRTLLGTLDASVEEAPQALDDRAEPEASPPSQEREPAEPLPAIRPQLQAAIIKGSRKQELSLLGIARGLKESLRSDRRDVRAKFDAEVERMRGKVS